MRRRGFLYVFSFFIIFAMIISLFPPTGMLAAEDEKTEECRLLLDVSEDDVIEVVISLESKMGVCALLSYLEYNPDSLLFLSGGAEWEKFNYKCVDFGGCVGVLLDSPENSPATCVLVRLYFKRIGGGEENFSLVCKKNGAVYVDGSGARNVSPTEIVYMIQGDGNGNGQDNAQEDAKPSLLSFGKHYRDEKTELCFSVKVGEDCFAGGVRLFCIDVSGGGRHFSVHVAGVVGEDGIFTGKYGFDSQKDYVVIVTAKGYKRNKSETGDKIITVLSPA